MAYHGDHHIHGLITAVLTDVPLLRPHQSSAVRLQGGAQAARRANSSPKFFAVRMYFMKATFGLLGLRRSW